MLSGLVYSHRNHAGLGHPCSKTCGEVFTWYDSLLKQRFYLCVDFDLCSKEEPAIEVIIPTYTPRRHPKR